MKVLFVSEIFENYVNAESLGIMYLSSVLKKNGHRTMFSTTDWADIESKLRGFQPAMVCYSGPTGVHQYMYRLNLEVKKHFPEVFSVFGGTHFLYTQNLVEQEGVDAICVGEAEEALLEFVEKLEAGADITSVRNFHVRHNGKVFRTLPRPVVEDLDSIPFPDRELEGLPHARRAKIKHVMPFRGCPYGCAYCFNSQLRDVYGASYKRIRYRSVDNVIAEIAYCKENTGAGLLYICADTFNCSLPWLEEFAEKYSRCDAILPYFCNIRADLVTPKIARLLKKSNCVTANIGIDGTTEAERKSMHRQVSDDALLRGCRLLKDEGINLVGLNVIGHPDNNIANEMVAVRLNRRLSVDYAIASFLTPYPNTELYRLFASRGLISPEYEYGLTFFKNSLIPYPNRAELDKFQCLFALLVEFPWLERVLPVLLRMPLHPLYVFLRALFAGYRHSRLLPYKDTLRNRISSALKWLYNQQIGKI